LVQKDRFLPKSPTKPPGESRPCSETKVVQTFLITTLGRGKLLRYNQLNIAEQ